MPVIEGGGVVISNTPGANGGPVCLLTGSGAPSAATSLAGTPNTVGVCEVDVGSIYVQLSNATVYVKSGFTLQAPGTWSAL